MHRGKLNGGTAEPMNDGRQKLDQSYSMEAGSSSHNQCTLYKASLRWRELGQAAARLM